MNKVELSVNSSHFDDAHKIVDLYASQSGGIRPDFHVKNRPDGPYLIIEFAQPSERNHKILNRIVYTLPDDNQFKDRATVQRRKSAPKQRLILPETQLLRREIAQSLTFDRNSFNEDFFSRYTASVTGFEQQITANANYVVYGRRGAGKSSLLAYAMHSATNVKAPYSWVAMQTYANRADEHVVPAVISEILYELNKTEKREDIRKLIEEFDVLAEGNSSSILVNCDKLIQKTRRIVGRLSSADLPLTIFLDDVHVISENIQPLVLGFVYKITRGNNAFIKVSGIAQLTKLWDSATHMGLQATQDAQLLNLDHNLTMPDKSKEHIVSILDAHARYCGLPNIGYLADDNVLSRLVLVAAGVPRDSLNLFSIAIAKAVAKSQKLVSITSINAAASEMAEEKLKDVERDSGGDLAEIQNILAEVKNFCIVKNRKNAFLVEILNADHRYHLVQKLAALRLVHILHEGITPNEAGKRYVALMLDYGFYVGIRAARSVELIPSTPRSLSARELRSLPIFRLSP
jgi:Cdc6-like AAA superfamily ATPase